MPSSLIFLLFFFGLIEGALASPAEEPEPADAYEILDQAQNVVGTKINSLANNLDSFFATERADDELGRSRLRLRYRYFTRERTSGEDDVDYRINLKLPRLQEKFKFEYYSKDEKNKNGPQPVAEREAIEKVKLNEVKKSWTFNADAGVNVSVPPRIVARARLRRNFEAGSFIHRFSEELVYITDERGLTQETQLQSDMRLNQTQLFRFINRAQWRILRKNFATFHGPTILHTLSEDDAFSYNFIMTNFIVDGVYFVNSYTASVNYRRNLYKNWVYLDIIPGIDFPKQWSFRRTPFAIFQLEVLFGG